MGLGYSLSNNHVETLPPEKSGGISFFVELEGVGEADALERRIRRILNFGF